MGSRERVGSLDGRGTGRGGLASLVGLVDLALLRPGNADGDHAGPGVLGVGLEPDLVLDIALGRPRRLGLGDGLLAEVRHKAAVGNILAEAMEQDLLAVSVQARCLVGRNPVENPDHPGGLLEEDADPAGSDAPGEVVLGEFLHSLNHGLVGLFGHGHLLRRLELHLEHLAETGGLVEEGLKRVLGLLSLLLELGDLLLAYLLELGSGRLRDEDVAIAFGGCRLGVRQLGLGGLERLEVGRELFHELALAARLFLLLEGRGGHLLDLGAGRLGLGQLGRPIQEVRELGARGHRNRRLLSRREDIASRLGASHRRRLAGRLPALPLGARNNFLLAHGTPPKGVG